eukprot:m.26643 g.26643  ORF g.26643 m.26643 type:complete len:199 (+) comp9962_c0_seq1:84-680(+)
MAYPMFGCLAATRLVDLSPMQVDVNRFIFTLAEPDSVNHLVVFLTGAMPFEPGFGASVHLCLSQAEQNWQLLGFLSNEKPSAIFKISRAKPAVDAAALANPFSSMNMPQATNAALVGISVEPLADLAQQTPVTQAAAPTASDLTLFTQRMLESLLNYASSFAVDIPGVTESLIGFSVVRRWHEQFMHKLMQDPLFWRK